MSQRLFKAIILQALQDLGNKRSSQYTDYDRHCAEQWLGTRDFYEICELADILPEQVIKAAKSIKEHGMTWRAPAGLRTREEQRKLWREKAMRRYHKNIDSFYDP